MKNIWIFLAIIISSYASDAYKILVVFPVPGKSHTILGDGIVRHLLDGGHEVSYVTAFPKNSTNPKLREIDVSSHLEKLKDAEVTISLKSIMDKKQDGMDQMVFLFLFQKMAVMTLEQENVQKVLRDPNEHFDLIVAEWMFNELYSGIAGVFNAPLVWVSTMEPHWMILKIIDEYTNPAYNGYSIDSSPSFTFLERVRELWFMIKMSAVRETVILYQQISTYNRLIVPIIKSRGRVAPSFKELRYNASLVLGNSHVSMGQAMTLPQSYKAVGGYHIEETPKPLTENLKKLLDNAKYGVIYFSLGSNLKSKNLPNELKKSLLEVFGSLKQTVLWKFEEELPNKPKNVYILDWAPQQSILTHPNCVLFITHGGLLSTTETILAGKPIIGIPVFADQYVNVARAVNKGFAKKVDLSYNMGPELKNAVEEILTNPRYTQRAKELSLIYHDRPVKPGVELVHWVEHVIKTGGAPHLRSPALMVPWYQKIYLDLILVILISLIALKTAITKLMSLRTKSDVIKKNK